MDGGAREITIEEIVRRRWIEQKRAADLGLLKDPYLPMAALNSWYLKWLKAAIEAGVRKETFDDIFMDIIDISLTPTEMEEQLKAAIPILIKPLTDTEQEYREALREQALEAARVVREALEAKLITPDEAGVHLRVPKDAKELIRLRKEVQKLRKELEEYKKKVPAPPITRPRLPPPPPYIASSPSSSSGLGELTLAEPELVEKDGLFVFEGEYPEILEDGYLEECVEEAPVEAEPLLPIPEQLKGKTLSEIKRLGLIPKLKEVLEHYLVKRREVYIRVAHRLKVDHRRILEWARALTLVNVWTPPKKRAPFMGKLTPLGVEPNLTKESHDGYVMDVFTFTPTKELAYIVGLAVADGRKYLGIDIKTKEIRSAYLAIVGSIDRVFEERIFDKATKVLEHMNEEYRKITGRDMPYKDRKMIKIGYWKHHDTKFSDSPVGKDFFTMTIANSFLARLVWDHNAELRFDVLERFKKEPELLKEFIAGLWDGDGWFTYFEPRFAQAMVRPWKDRLVGWLERTLAEMMLEIRPFEKPKCYTVTTREFVSVYESASLKEVYVKEVGRDKFYKEIGVRMQKPDKVEVVKEYLRKAPWVPW